MKALLIAVALIAVAYTAPTTLKGLESYTYDQYLTEFEKTFDNPMEKQIHFEIFENNMIKLRNHMKDETKSWQMGVTKFMDMTDKEFKSFRGFSMNKKRQSMMKTLRNEQAEFTPKKVDMKDLPASFDWRDHGVVTAVKNQGMCGSCWAFAATEALESAAAIASNSDPVTLAPQQLVDCTPNPDKCGGTGGCEGATFELAYDYLTGMDGQALERDYRYYQRDMQCKDSSATFKAAVSMTGYTNVDSNNQTAVMEALVNGGPLGIVVDAGGWGMYWSGVFDSCSYSENIDLDHGVLLVGYGEENGKKFWIVRNSWGGSWGREGYIYLARDDTAQCGMDNTPGDGVACQGDTTPQKVCGQCGMLFDAVLPTGATVTGNGNDFMNVFEEME